MIRTVALDPGSVPINPNNLFIILAWIVVLLLITIRYFFLTEE
jgi:hypothetical protein